MKFIILLAIIAIAAAQRPGYNHGDPLHRLIYTEVRSILSHSHGISVERCTTKCDNLFDLNGGHDEEMTDYLCHAECYHQIYEGNHFTTQAHHVHPHTTVAPTDALGRDQ